MLLELHAHTHYSHGTKIHYDAIHSPEDMVRTAAQKGLDAIAITDHDTLNGIREAVKCSKKYGIEVIPGEEISSNHGHIVALGISEVVPAGLDLHECLDRIHSQGGIAISSHPFAIKSYGLGKLCRYCDAVEAFNSQNLDRISNLWALKFIRKHSLSPVASSDAHSTSMIGHGITEVKADNIDSALKEIKKGRTKLHAKYTPLDVISDVVQYRLQMSYDSTINYMDNNCSLPIRFMGKQLIKLVQKNDIDNLFKLATYLSLSGVVTYNFFRLFLDDLNL